MSGCVCPVGLGGGGGGGGCLVGLGGGACQVSVAPSSGRGLERCGGEREEGPCQRCTQRHASGRGGGHCARGWSRPAQVGGAGKKGGGAISLQHGIYCVFAS